MRTPRFLTYLTLLPLLMVGSFGAIAQEGPGDDDPYLAAEARRVRLIGGLRRSVVVVSCYQEAEGPTAVSSFCGVVFDARGRIATIGRRIAEADRIEVELVDGRRYAAESLAFDRQTGICLLAIVDPPDDLQPITPGDSDRIEVGATLIAIGNPFGFGHSVSTGIVSGVDRVVHSHENTFTGMIQTTVPVNPGDAGGLVSDSRGRTIGLIASTFARAPSAGGLPSLMDRLKTDPVLQQRIDEIQRQLLRIQEDPELTPQERMRRLADLFSQMQDLLGGPDSMGSAKPLEESHLGAQAINFVMPINTILWVVEGLIEDGRVTRGWLGVGVDVALENGREAITVSNVVEDGPAAAAGVRVGDRIAAYLGEAIDRLDLLRRLTVRTPPGKKITLDVTRDGERIRLEIVMGERP